MEKVDIMQESRGEQTQIRRPYHAPKLTILGEIQSIVQSNNGMGTDGNIVSSTQEAS